MHETIEGQPRHRFPCRFAAILLLATSFVPWFHSAEAQQSAKVPKIGWLGARPAATAAAQRELLGRALRALGYVEGKNIAFEYRYADNKVDQLPTLADELVRHKVDVLVTTSTTEALAAKNATRTIPIVFFGTGDPVSAGLVDSFARPGGNITGFTTIAPVLAGKRLELLKETFLSKTDRGTGDKKPAAVDLQSGRLCGQRWIDVLWNRPRRTLQACRGDDRQDSKGNEARRHTRRAADEV
jgi:hypothetical protein